MNNLETLRKAKKLNRRELSDKCGIPSRTIVSWERDERNIEIASYISIVKLAKALEIDVNELFAENSDARM